MESMTGYGRAWAEEGSLRVLAEIRGVNNKGLDIHVYLPGSLLRHEMALRTLVRSTVARGRVEVRVSLEVLGEQAAEVHVSEGVARALGKLASKLHEEGILARGLTLGDLMGLPDAVQVRLDPAAETQAGKALLSAVGTALREFKTARSEEGDRLEAQFRQGVQSLATHTAAAAALTERQLDAARVRLSQKVQQMGISVEPGRMEQEVALSAERADVEEELVRLDSHLQAFKGLLDESPADQGRRLDHLFQEMQRETSTLLAKAGLVELTQVGLQLRLLVEQLREQAQNVA
jgi:uncharacterized protein (TIGR00255 family)